MADAHDPHRDQPVLSSGASLDAASGAMILIHGRGASADDILGVANVLKRPDLAYLAPEAAAHVWYPQPFMTPTSGNEPWLTSALATVGRLVAHIEGAGIPPNASHSSGSARAHAFRLSTLPGTRAATAPCWPSRVA